MSQFSLFALGTSAIIILDRTVQVGLLTFIIKIWICGCAT